MQVSQISLDFDFQRIFSLIRRLSRAIFRLDSKEKELGLGGSCWTWSILALVALILD
jgi:hypothetical protein